MSNKIDISLRKLTKIPKLNPEIDELYCRGNPFDNIDELWNYNLKILEIDKNINYIEEIHVYCLVNRCYLRWCVESQLGSYHISLMGDPNERDKDRYLKSLKEHY